MARIHFRHEDQPSIKKTPIPSRKWKNRFMFLVGVDILFLVVYFILFNN